MGEVDAAGVDQTCREDVCMIGDGGWDLEQVCLFRLWVVKVEDVELFVFFLYTHSPTVRFTLLIVMFVVCTNVIHS